MSQGVYVLGGKCPGGKCPRGKCPGGMCPWGKCPGGIFVVYKNEDLEVGVLGDGICFVLQHSDTGIKAT